MSPRPTIEDVAAMAGVSTATVSRTLHDPEVVSKKSRLVVTDAIRRTGYTQNTAAQNLRQQRARAILVLVPDIGNNYFSEILSGAERAASEAGYTVLIGDTGYDAKRESDLLRYLSNGRADGALLLTGSLPEGMALGNPAIVSVSERVEASGLLHVGIDNIAAAKAATQHLIQLGHRHIAHLQGPASNVLSIDRLAGFQMAMEENGLAVDEGAVMNGDFTTESGEHAADILASRTHRPSAVFCANDEMAIGLISRLHSHGISVPSDLSIVGFDDIRFAHTYIPALTTIHQPRKRIGERGISSLLNLLDSQNGGPQAPITLDWELVVRDSTAAPTQRSG